MESIEGDMVDNRQQETSNSHERPSYSNLPSATEQTDGTPPNATIERTSPSKNLISSGSKQLTAGFLQIIEPPVAKVRSELKELIFKQNKIYIDLSAEKFKLDSAEMVQLPLMMNSVKFYRDKLFKIKKDMQSIYQRTSSLKKRAHNIVAYKQKELQRKLQKQQQEEALIGK